jgi:hypothetical protein
MGIFSFERECRTASSECFTILEDDSTIGRVDIHFTPMVVHSTLTVAESLTSDEIQDLIDTIDEELLDCLGVERQEVIVHVHQGRDIGVYSSSDFEGTNGGGIERRN